MTAVEEIRRAAALMRERAQKAQASPWTWPDIAPLHSAIPEREHVASWHPAVALAVADWLDAAASVAEEYALDPDGNLTPGWTQERVMPVVRAYLGDQS